MKAISINGVTVEQYGRQYQAHEPISGLWVVGETPMIAYIKFLKLQADQLADDLAECFCSLRFDLHRMEVSK